jgi:hypothetical protein
MVPGNISIYGNHFFKQLSWRGSTWQVKNLFEVKAGRNIRVRYNVFENVWPAAQPGFAINLKASTCDSQNQPYVYTRGVHISHNLIMNTTGGGITASGKDVGRSSCSVAGPGSMTAFSDDVIGSGSRFTDLAPGWKIIVAGQTRTVVSVVSATQVKVDQPFNPAIGTPTAYRFLQPVAGQLSDVMIHDNVLDGVGRGFQLLYGTQSVHIRHNTVIHDGPGLLPDSAYDGKSYAHTDFAFRGNILTNGSGVGIKGSGLGEGKPTLDANCPGGAVDTNVIANETTPAVYP